MTEEIIQGSPEWHALRCGKLTASRLPDAIAKIKNGWGASRSTLLGKLVSERRTNRPYPEGFQSAAMEHGNASEKDARDEYRWRTGLEVQEIAFVDHPTIEWAGCSPDGFVGTDGLIEIKCPNTWTHLCTLEGAPIDGRYLTQMQWQMACTGRQWCDFVSFDPRLIDPDHPERDEHICIQRVARLDSAIQTLEQQALAFLEEVAEKIRGLDQRAAQKAAA